VLTKEKLGETSSKLGDIFKNIFVSNCKAKRCVLIISTMLKYCCIHVHRRKILVHELCDTSREARVNFVNWYPQAVHEGKTNPTRIQ
jgi:hypothetical protein